MTPSRWIKINMLLRNSTFFVEGSACTPKGLGCFLKALSSIPLSRLMTDLEKENVNLRIVLESTCILSLSSQSPVSTPSSRIPTSARVPFRGCRGSGSRW